MDNLGRGIERSIWIALACAVLVSSCPLRGGNIARFAHDVTGAVIWVIQRVRG